MKKISSLLIIVAFVFVTNKIVAQQLTPPQQQAVNKLFKTSSVVYYKFKVHSLSEIPQFAKPCLWINQMGQWFLRMQQSHNFLNSFA